jgi:hypothetical protein
VALGWSLVKGVEPQMKITDEVLQDQPDLVEHIQRRLTYELIRSERAALAAVTSWQLAWQAYLPTPLDKPEDYAPYLIRLTEHLKGVESQ